MNKLLRLGMIMLGLTIGVYLAVAAIASQDVPRISKEELRGKLGNPDVIILDVRLAKDWDASDVKVKGAAREDMREVNSWASKYPKEKTIVLYCA